MDLLQPADHVADICATLLYPVTDRPYRELYELACGMAASRRRQEIVGRGAWERAAVDDELPRHFRSAPTSSISSWISARIVILHRHRRCQQFRQQYTNRLGYETPEIVREVRSR